MTELNVVFIKAFDLNDAWYQCIKAAIEKGHEYTITCGSYEGQKRKEFDFITVQITNPGNRPLAPIVPEGMIPPTNDETIEKYFLEYLATDQKKPDEDYTYGQRLTNPAASLTDRLDGLKMKNVNQPEEVIRMYKEGGHGTNQATMEIATPFDIQLKDPPCMRLIDTRVRYGKLHFMTYFRSWDLVGGFPANLGALQLLKEHMAKEIGVEDGEIMAQSKGLHIYEHYWDYAKIRTYKNDKTV
ncbi:MAG: thymidylate synthase [archaeon]